MLADPEPPPPPPPAEEVTEDAETGDETETVEQSVTPEEVPVPPAQVEDTAEEPSRSGYADSTGNLETLDDSDGLRVTVRGGALRAKRGYTPLEVTLQNTESVPRSVRLSFQGYGAGSPATVRAVELGPLQRMITYLLVPEPVQSGILTVEGPDIRPRTNGIYMDEANAIATLVLGTSKAFEASTGIGRAEERATPQVNARFMSAQDAPRELAAYAGYPAVMVIEDVASVPAELWSVLENYAAVGGSLLIARPPRDVTQRLPLLAREPKREVWNPYGFGFVYLCQAGTHDCGAALLASSEERKLQLEPIGPAPSWEPDRYSLRGGEQPLLPNALVPVGRFLVLIFLFSLVVGPGGLMLARRKGPVALLIGVPAVALLTCLLIVADSVLGDGFITHASRYSYTWLDRPRDRLVTASLASYYANLAPDEVQFPSTGVLMAPEELNDWRVDVSWTGGGMVADGLIPSRTYVEWAELAVLPTRARLVVHAEGEGWKVQNALGAPLQGGFMRVGRKEYTLPELADGAEGMAMEAHPEPGEEVVLKVVNPPSSVSRRVKGDAANFVLPLQEGEFVARLGGAGFSPLATLPVQLHEGIHYIRGQVDQP
ncbi:hypothetical protein [Hyalangium versicolor]|uniref:hypothetical protein n=1 Tax=Hyalangium versicolor TaxID=2861190 RepID=UPI001CCAC5AA|nr:hypothetical protein [Hyalangium versicolor]